MSDHFISMKVKSTGKNVEVPYGMVVWSTGVGTRPFVKDFMEQVGQVSCISFLFVFHGGFCTKCILKKLLFLSLLINHHLIFFISPLKEKRRILTTDEWLRVKGCSNVYALGDCASVDQRKVMVKKPYFK